MNWLILALLSQFVFSLVNFIDKYIIEKEVPNYLAMPIYGSIMGFTAGTLLWITTGFPTLQIRDALLLIFAGMLVIWAAAFYFKALSQEATSNVIFLFQLSPAIVLIFSSLFLNESITHKQLLGFFLILIPALVISLKKERKHFKISSTLLLILLVDILWAANSVLVKFVVESTSFAKVVSYESWGVGLGGIPMYLFVPSVRQAFHDTTKTVTRFALGVIFFNEGVFVAGKLLRFLALSIGPVSLVSVLGGTQVFIGILYGWLLTMTAPSIFREDLSIANLLKKTALALLMFCGIWLIY